MKNPKPLQIDLWQPPVMPAGAFMPIDKATPRNKALLVRCGASLCFASTSDGVRWSSVTGGRESEVRPTHWMPEPQKSGLTRLTRRLQELNASQSDGETPLLAAG